MPEPSDYQAIANLQAALKNIAIAGGYHFNVAATAVKLDPNQNVEALIAPGGPRPFIVLEVQPDGWLYSPANRASVDLPISIHWVSESVPTDDTSRTLTYFRGCADVERALAVDISRGGFAIDTKIVTRRYNNALDGSQIWAEIDVKIHTRRVYGQPDA